MSRDYSTVDAYFAKQNLFYEWCNDIAQSIYDEFQEDNTNKTAEEFFCNEYDYVFTSIMEVEAEDYINSYGIFRALKEYRDEYGCEPTNAMMLLEAVAREKIDGRFDGLCEEASRRRETKEE
jgi:hypothetical protein